MDRLAQVRGGTGRSRGFTGLSIVQTRLIVSVGVLLLALFSHVFDQPARIAWVISIYIVLTVALVVFGSALLDLKRVRAFPILFDLVAISFLVASTGGLQSPWFLLYLFPVMSASRYLGPNWTVLIATLATATYSIACFVFAGSRADFSFWLRAVTLFGAALTSANLARSRDHAEKKLVQAIEKIDREILTETDLEHVMPSILDAAIELTASDLSAIVLVEGGEVTAAFTAARDSEPTNKPDPQDRVEAERIVKQHCLQVLDLGKPFSLPENRPFAILRQVMGRPDPSARWPAKLVPLQILGIPFGVLGVFSRRGLHYFTPNDVTKLESMASLVAMAQKNAKLFRELGASERRVKERLEMLYGIGEQLKDEQELDPLFQDVVKLVSDRLRSEEAALFIPDDQGNRVKKVAVAGPDEEITAVLKGIEPFYEKGESLTGSVFATKEFIWNNKIDETVSYVGAYSAHLPSRRARHYLGVPLRIGEEVLGVIRVLNKKGVHYAPRSSEAKLAETGFEEDDVDLLKMIAIQIASAIRSARFIERNRYFEKLVYDSPDPIIVLDKEGKIQNFNRKCEEIWGLRESDVRGQPVENYYESTEHARDIGRALWKDPEHTIHDFDARIRHASRDIIPILLSATLFLDKDGQAAGSIGVFKDEREMLRQEEERLRKEKLAVLGRLAQTTCHDIKHNIGAIQHSLKPFEREARSNPDKLEAYSSIRTAANEALGKLRNLLMTAGPGSPFKRAVAIKPELATFAESIRFRASLTDVEFSSRYPDCNPFILADIDQLRQVFANLFGNSLDAIKSARQGRPPRIAGKIDLTVELDDGGEALLLTWRDDGCGFSEEAKQRAFTAFFTTKKNGNGLGLHITKSIVEYHGGQIALESAEGEGACFRIKLPLYHGVDVGKAVPS